MLYIAVDFAARRQSRETTVANDSRYVSSNCHALAVPHGAYRWTWSLEGGSFYFFLGG